VYINIRLPLAILSDLAELYAAFLAFAVIIILTRRQEGGIGETWIKGVGIKRETLVREALK
jgi:hypothetical protein